MILKRIFFVLLILTLPSKLFGDTNVDDNDHQFNLFTGNFDFSDDKQKATLLGFQHQNENLNRNTFLGNISPVTGVMFMQNSASYVYTGIQAQYKVGKLNFNPSFTPGLYGEGNGKNLGHIVEFKSELQLTVDLFENSEFGIKYNHLSNANLGDKNPGANSYMLNFLKRF